MPSIHISYYPFVAVFLLTSCLSISADTEFSYDMSDIGALQSEYQKQLKKPKKKAVSKPIINTKTNVKPRQQTNAVTAQQYLQRLQKQQQQAARKKQLQQHKRQRQTQQRNIQPGAARQQPAPKTNIIRVPTNNELFDAASRGDVRTIGQLISRGVNVNSGNAERETALHMAAAKGQYSAVIYLINHGANINARTVNNWLPIHHATRFRHAQIANYLKQRGSSPYAKTSDGLSAIDMAKALNDRRILGAFGVR